MAGIRRLCAPCFCGIAANGFLAKRGVPLVIELDNETVCSAEIMNRLVRSTWSPSPPPICHDAQIHGEPWADPIARLGKQKAGPSSFPADFSLWAEPPSGSVSALWRKQVSCRGSLSCNMQTTAMRSRDRHPTSKRASAVWFERRHYWLAPMYQYVMAAH